MRVGFIGLGAIGWPMAGTLVKAGHDVLAFDIDRERLNRFAIEFACPVASGLAAVAERDFVITMLPTGDIVREVLLHQENAAFRKAVRPGTLVIDMGSSDPRGTQALGAELRKFSVELVDAPVSKRVAVFTASGTPVARATAIPMVIMIGGDAGAVARAKPLLADIGDTLFETGPLGSAHALKALNNYASAASHVALAEALLAGTTLRPRSQGDDRRDQRLDRPQLCIRGSVQETDRQPRLPCRVLDWALRQGCHAGSSILLAAVGLDAPMARLTSERWALARDKLGAHGRPHGSDAGVG